MTDTVEGFAVLKPGSPLLHRWVIPGTDRTITWRNGSVGLIQAHNALRIHELVERLDQPGEHRLGADDGGHVFREITGGNTWSKHATGAAGDLNWRRHPYNTPTLSTWTPKQVRVIRSTLRLYIDLRTGKPVLEWGGNWPSHPGSTAKTDSMHWQISSQVRMAECERVARRLMLTPRGRRILAANPGQKAVILS